MIDSKVGGESSLSMPTLGIISLLSGEVLRTNRTL